MAPIGMAEGDRPAVDVDPVHVRVVLFLPGEHDRGEGLVDLDEVDVDELMPARSSTLVVAGIGPVSIVTGSTPTTANSTKRARGLKAELAAFSSLMTRTADAPSVIWDELPAVSLPPRL